MDLGSKLRTVAVGVGAAFLARLSFRLVLSFHFFFIRRTGVQRYLSQTAGDGKSAQASWAVITGSSTGIGRALAFELAGHGFNIVLHGFNEARLLALKEELEATFPKCHFRALPLDVRLCLKLDGPRLTELLDGVVEKLKDIDVRILINNVGTPQARPEVRPPFGALEEFTYDELRTNVTENAVFHLLFTRALYPLLTATDEPRLVMNIGSIAERFPCFPSYGPSKAFTLRSADALRLENKLLSRDNIDVLGIDVMSTTDTGTIKVPDSVLVPTASKYAKSVVRCMGYRGADAGRVAPYLPHALMLGFIDGLPVWLRDRVVLGLMADMLKQAKETVRKGEDLKYL